MKTLNDVLRKWRSDRLDFGVVCEADLYSLERRIRKHYRNSRQQNRVSTIPQHTQPAICSHCNDTGVLEVNGAACPSCVDRLRKQQAGA